MIWLVVVSFIWAFSFGLIKGRLTGLDPSLISLLRVTLALLVFLPLLRARGLGRRDLALLLGIGAVQFGLMYVCYIAAYRFLAAHQIAVWTIFTPVFVCATHDLAERRLRAGPYLAALLAIVGAGIVTPLAGDEWRGIALVQVSNLCFAAGQVAYRRWRHRRPEVEDARVFGFLYAGAALACLLPAAPALESLARISGPQWLTLIYLGVIASGLGFFLWNYGAVRSTPATLAVANNLKIPLAVAVSLLVFHERADVPRLALGGALVLAAGALAEWLDRRGRRPALE